MIPSQSRPDVLLRQSGLKVRNFDALYNYFIENANNSSEELEAIAQEQSIRGRQLLIRYTFGPFTPVVASVLDILRDIGMGNVTLQVFVPINQGARLISIYRKPLSLDAVREIVQNLWDTDPLEDVIVFLRTSTTLNIPTVLETSRSSTYRNQANFRIASLSSVDRTTIRLQSFEFNVARNLDANFSLVNINATIFSQSLEQTLDFRISVQMGQLMTVRASWKDAGGLLSVPMTPVSRIGGSSAIGRIRLGTNNPANLSASSITNRVTIFVPAASTKVKLAPNPQPL